jgi:hypothetical protein
MSDEAVGYADDQPEPRTSCPSAVVSPILAVVFGVQLLFTLVLVVVGIGLPTAALFAVSLLVVDLVITTSKSSQLQAILPGLLRWILTGGSAWRTRPEVG